MQFTLQQAADATGKAKSTIQRAIKSGKLSASIDIHGNYSIDSSELDRVYSLQTQRCATVAMEQHATDETELLRVKLELIQMQLEREREVNSDLLSRLDASETERRQLTLMLTHKPEPANASKPAPVESKLLLKLFGKPNP